MNEKDPSKLSSVIIPEEQNRPSLLIYNVKTFTFNRKNILLVM